MKIVQEIRYNKMLQQDEKVWFAILDNEKTEIYKCLSSDIGKAVEIEMKCKKLISQYK